MCGIAGFFNPPSACPSHEMNAIVTAMTNAIILRGPDDAGAWVDSTSGIALGHRRLSILDLSPLGHQPMNSADGRFVIVFNGEIYNFQDLRAELEPLGHTWRGHSDTEVMLAAFRQWGVIAATQRFNGMFAFAVWDKQERMLHLARDRMGEKPLYYGWIGETFVFASELKAIQRFPGFNATVDREALTSLLRFNYIPDPLCIHQGFKKLPPAAMLSFKAPSERPQPGFYWSLPHVVERGLDNPFKGTEAEAIDTFESMLKKAVGMRMVSDVPLGAFLSGGIDSSLIVAMMQKQSARPVRTFTIGFHEKQYNEAEIAKSVAKHLGTEHTEMYVTGEDALNVIPQLPALYDEPFADYSQIPTHLVCKMAKQHVTVALSGDAGDELFGGYERYGMGRSLHSKFAWMPPALKKLTAAALTAVPPGPLNTLGSKLLPKSKRHIPVGDKLHKLAEVVAAPGIETLYLNLMSYWKKPTDIVIDGNRIASVAPHGAAPYPAGAKVIEAPNQTAIPGLIEFHAHTQKDFGSNVEKAWLAYGITTVRDVSSETPKTIQLRARSLSGDLIGPRLYVYARYAYMPVPRNEVEARQRVRDLKAQGADGLKLFGMDKDVYPAVLDEAKKPARPPAPGACRGGRLSRLRSLQQETCRPQSR